LKNGGEVFSKKAKDAKTEAEEKEERLLKTIGQLKVENDFLPAGRQV
jgi:transposase